VKSKRTRIASTRPSLHDVAKVAGVSTAAVSYVVNGRTNEIGAETHVRIKKAIELLGYQPQRSGLSLKLNRQFAIGFVVVDPDPSFLADPFTTQVASGLSNALVEPGYGLTVTGCRTGEDLDKLLRKPIGVDGFVVMTSGTKHLRDYAYRSLSNAQLPLVVVQEDVPADIQDACAVLQDDAGGARLLACYLLDCGASNFLFVSPSRDWPAIERREVGIRSALAGRAHLARVECNEQDFDGSVAAIGQRIDRGPIPDVIMGANDQIAIAAMRALSHRGLSVPSDIMVTGYNNFVFRNYVDPRLTTVSSSAQDLGRKAAIAILSRLDEGVFPERRVELPVLLDIGGSTLPLRPSGGTGRSSDTARARSSNPASPKSEVDDDGRRSKPRRLARLA
jgi:DNA-binding LacI/PurR family transcriptional regulator